MVLDSSSPTAVLSSDQSSTTVGFHYYVTGSFSDANQHYPWITGSSHMYISWGDGQVDDVAPGFGLLDSADFGHTYAHAGTYNVEMDALYEDDNSNISLSGPIFQAIDHTTVVIHPVDPYS